MRRATILATVLVAVFLGSATFNYSFTDKGTQGSLQAFSKGAPIGLCPLRHTEVRARISGFVARVNVKQEFKNSFAFPIEAVYTFPLSSRGAVDKMTMTIGDRVIKGSVMRRDDARKVYEDAKQQGRSAALLDQERPNVFTQSVANIMPGEKIVVEISYVETLDYDSGVYEFVFPMVVGPRYLPGKQIGKKGSGVSPDTEQVPDGSKISPRIASNRAGHDITIEVDIDAGVPIESIESTLHEIESQDFGAGSAKILLKDRETIPNKDFILRYGVSGPGIEDALLTHRDERGGFFTMILQPPDLGAYEDVAPKEIVFVLDTSGSMEGFPIEKAKDAMRKSLMGLYPDDTFNLITFAGDTEILFDGPVPASQANIEQAMAFLNSRKGDGGTEMMKAITAALEPSDSREHIRVVCFMTDGLVGNEGAIIDEVKKHPNARVFSFGIGDSVNRHLLEKIAEEGNGEATIVTLEDESARAAESFYQRVRAPLLTDISVDWNGLPVADIYPTRIPDLFSAKPVILKGRYTAAAEGSIVLKGRIGGQPFERELKVTLPEVEEDHDSLATIWARKRIEDLTREDYEGVQNRTADESLAEEITNVALEFGIASQYTSFVAVEDFLSNPGGSPALIAVPVESSGDAEEADKGLSAPGLNSNVSVATNGGGGGGKGSARGTGIGTGFGTGSGSGSGTGNGSGSSPSGNASVNAVVSVSGSRSKIDSSISSSMIVPLPKGANFVSLLRVEPNVTPQPLGGGFQIDGASGAENVFVIDGREVNVFRSGQLNSFNYVADTRVVTAPEKIRKPTLPKRTKVGESVEKVAVAILVDETGDVYAAKAGSGSSPFREAAERAARGSSFSPASLDGMKLRLSGVLEYEFLPDGVVNVALLELKTILPPAVRRSIVLKHKLHFWVYAAVDRIGKDKSAPTSNEKKFVSDGVASLRIRLSDTSAETMRKLNEAGVKIHSKGVNEIRGAVSVDRIAVLAEFSEVKFISP